MEINQDDETHVGKRRCLLPLRGLNKQGDDCIMDWTVFLQKTHKSKS